MSTSTQQAREAGEQATRAGKEVTQTAMEGAQQVMGDVRQQGMQMTHEATQQFHDLAHEASTQLRDQASTQADRAAMQLRQLSEQAMALAEGRTGDAGPLPQYAQQVTERLSNMAQRLENGGAEGALDDIRRFARRKPGTFLLLAGMTGFAAGRIMRSERAASQQQTTDQQQSQPPFMTADEPAVYLDDPLRNPEGTIGTSGTAGTVY